LVSLPPSSSPPAPPSPPPPSLLLPPSLFDRYYNNFILCTEHKVSTAKCFWPNPLAEGFITGIHRQFFTNCTSDKVHWEDPPDKILVPLIFIPILLTVAMVGL
ncbi:Receptor activity-modifying protein 3, partial [Ophiophagus hannah]